MADVSTYKVYGTLPTIGEEQVKKLIEQSESGALPEVTADDNGKVLTVVDGEWDKANSGGGGGVDIFVVNLTPDSPISTTKYTADVSTEDIGEAMLNGKLVVAKLQTIDDGMHVSTQTNFVSFSTGVYSTTLSQTTIYAAVFSGDTYEWQISS